MSAPAFDPQCEACTFCAGCGRAWCRDETPSPGDDARICADCWDADEGVGCNPDRSRR